MPKKNTFIERHLHLFILGIASATSLGALVLLSRFNTAQLNAFGPTAKLYFSSIKNGLTVSTIILLCSFAIVLLFSKHLNRLQIRLKYFYRAASDTKKNLLVLAICLVFAFATHAGNIVNGYFNMDDFEVISVNRTVPFFQSLFIPHGNDHSLPLFRAEMRTLDALFGQNQIPYNLFIFLMFALVPFFTYLSFRILGIGIKSFAVFLILFTSATGWNDLVPGFYIMSIYLQEIFFFSAALWAYLAWERSKEKKYILIFAISMVGALTIDISGIWTLPAIILVLASVSYMKNNAFKVGKKYLTDFFEGNRVPLVIIIEIILAFAIFLIITFFVIQPDTFLSVLNGEGTTSDTATREESWKLIPLTENFFSLFASGVSLSLIAPKMAQILAHPAIKEKSETIWLLLKIIILLGNALLLWFTVKHAEMREKKLIILFLGIMSITILMVIIARPNHDTINDFDYRYAGAAFYAYCIFLALSASIFLKTKKEYALKIIVPMVIVIFSAQQAFSFQSVRISEEAKMRKEAIQNLNTNLLSEIDRVSKEKKDGPLIIPNLNGGHIFEQTLAGFTLSYYVLFFNRHMPVELIQSPEMSQDNRTHTVTSVSNLRASTSPEFIEALKKSEIIRSYYFSPATMSYKFTAGSSSAVLLLNTKKEVLIQEKGLDPEKIHTVNFVLITDNTPGNLELAFSFKNDFMWEGATGKIRVDDFTPYEIKDGKRVYRIETDLLQLYAYALSDKVSNLTLSVPETKNAFISDVTLK
jgi:hypothetical protein